MDQNQNAYVVGSATSTDFPVKNAYQVKNHGGGGDGFIAKFDKSGDLKFNTFLGGSSTDYIEDIAIDQNGIYVTGYTFSSDFPMKYAWNSTNTAGTDEDSFVAKYTLDGELLWSTFYSGTLKDQAFGIKVDNQSNIYILGQTTSSNLPVTPDAFQQIQNGSSDFFIAEFNTTGSLVFSSYLGGISEEINPSLSINPITNEIVISGATSSSNFPITQDALNKTGTFPKAFITKIDNKQIVYSTLFGGSNSDQATSVAVDNSGNTYLCGLTFSNVFPLTSDAYSTTLSNGNDLFVSKFDSNNNIIYSTYFGSTGSDDSCKGITFDNYQNIYFAGYTDSSTYPTKSAYSPEKVSVVGYDSILTKFNNLHPPTITTSSTSGTSVPTTTSQITINSNTNTNTNSLTVTNSSNHDFLDPSLLSNPVFDLIGGLFVVSLLINIIFVRKRRK